jgi:hypothetical protein
MAYEPAEAKQAKRVQRSSPSGDIEASDDFELEYKALGLDGGVQRPVTRQRGIDYANGYQLYQQKSPVTASPPKVYEPQHSTDPEISDVADMIMATAQRRAIAESLRNNGSIAPVPAPASVAARVPALAPLLLNPIPVAQRHQTAATRGGPHKEQSSEGKPEPKKAPKEATRRGVIVHALQNKDSTTAEGNHKSLEFGPEKSTISTPSETNKQPPVSKKRLRPVVEDNDGETDEEPQKRARTSRTCIQRTKPITTSRTQPEKYTETVVSSSAPQESRSQPNGSGTNTTAAARKPLAPKPKEINNTTSSQTHKRSHPDEDDISQAAKRARITTPQPTAPSTRTQQSNGARTQPGKDVPKDPVKRIRGFSAPSAGPAAVQSARTGATQSPRTATTQPARMAATLSAQPAATPSTRPGATPSTRAAARPSTRTALTRAAATPSARPAVVRPANTIGRLSARNGTPQPAGTAATPYVLPDQCVPPENRYKLSKNKFSK